MLNLPFPEGTVDLGIANRLPSGLNAEFVPREFGGRLGRLDALARVMRAVFRRDASLGLGYGMISFLAAAVVWTSGSEAQRRAVARLLLNGGRLCSAYPEPARGNAFLRNGFTAARDGDGFVLDGRKEALANVCRASSLVVFARTKERGPGGHTAFLLDLPELAPGPGSLAAELKGPGHALFDRRCKPGPDRSRPVFGPPTGSTNRFPVDVPRSPTGDFQVKLQGAMDEALRCKASGERKVIAFNFCGHGHFDLSAYERYMTGKLEDYEYPAEQVKAALAGLPKIKV